MNEAELRELLEYFETRVQFARHLRIRAEEVQAGRASFSIDLDEIHLNGGGVVHGGVHASLIDTAMGISVASLGVRAATTQLNVHLVGAVSRGLLLCRGEVIHRTRRTATAEARIHDTEGNLLALGTGAFRVFEPLGDAPLGDALRGARRSPSPSANPET